MVFEAVLQEVNNMSREILNPLGMFIKGNKQNKEKEPLKAAEESKATEAAAVSDVPEYQEKDVQVEHDSEKENNTATTFSGKEEVNSEQPENNIYKIDWRTEQGRKELSDALTYDNIVIQELEEDILDDINDMSAEEQLEYTKKLLKDREGTVYLDPLGNKLYFAPGNTESLHEYAFHLIAGKEAMLANDMSKIRASRVLAVILAEKTIEKPFAIVEQENGRRVCVAVYRSINNYANSIIVGVEEGQDGRIVTATIAQDKKRDKKAALREVKTRIGGERTKQVLYCRVGQSGYSRPTSSTEVSKGNIPLGSTGELSIAKDTEDVNDKEKEPLKAAEESIATALSGDEHKIYYVSGDEKRTADIRPYGVNFPSVLISNSSSLRERIAEKYNVVNLVNDKENLPNAPLSVSEDTVPVSEGTTIFPNTEAEPAVNEPGKDVQVEHDSEIEGGTFDVQVEHDSKKESNGSKEENVSGADEAAGAAAAGADDYTSYFDGIDLNADMSSVRGKREVFRRNVACIRMAKSLKEEGRYATPKEAAFLKTYAGWGGMPEVFDPLN